MLLHDTIVRPKWLVALSKTAVYVLFDISLGKSKQCL
jgi:hypothetical protein